MKGHAAIVTGGSRGIGKGIARVLAQAGVRVMIGGRDRDALESTVAELCADGGDVHGMVGDLTRQADIVSLVSSTAATFGRLDILCANAGAFPACNLKDMTEDLWDALMIQNLRSTAFTVQAAAAEMRKAGYGRVVITSSITGPITGYPGWSHYGATKAGQLGFMRTAALELAPHGITVNAVLPGNILTEAISAMGQDYVDAMTRAIPARMLGMVEDIGHAVKFLASPEARFITAQTLVVDGGQVTPETEAGIL